MIIYINQIYPKKKKVLNHSSQFEQQTDVTHTGQVLLIVHFNNLSFMVTIIDSEMNESG